MPADEVCGLPLQTLHLACPIFQTKQALKQSFISAFRRSVSDGKKVMGKKSIRH